VVTSGVRGRFALVVDSNSGSTLQAGSIQDCRRLQTTGHARAASAAHDRSTHAIPMTSQNGAATPWDRLYGSFNMLNQDQVAAIRQANLELFFGLSSTAVEGVGKLAALNMQAIRATLSDTFDLALKSLSVKEPQDWLALQNSVVAPTAEKVQSYSRQVLDIVSATQAECVRIGQAQGEACGRRMQTGVLDVVTKNAPSGSEAALTALNSAIAAANTLYETLQAAGQQALEVTRSNLEMTAAASKSARSAIDPASPAAKR
jgi:phasin family protein